MSTTLINGRRKSLAEQIDRLDAILDGLADGLHEAIAQAVKEAVTVAVEAAVRELLASAQLQRRLRPAHEPGLVRVSVSAVGRGAGRLAKRCWGWLKHLAVGCQEMAAEVLSVVEHGGSLSAEGGSRLVCGLARLLWLGGVMGLSLMSRFRRPLIIALASGTLVGIVCYLAGPTVSSVVSGVGGFVGSLVVTALGRLRRMLRGNCWRDWSADPLHWASQPPR